MVRIAPARLVPLGFLILSFDNKTTPEITSNRDIPITAIESIKPSFFPLRNSN